MQMCHWELVGGGQRSSRAMASGGMGTADLICRSPRGEFVATSACHRNGDQIPPCAPLWSVKPIQMCNTVECSE